MYLQRLFVCALGCLLVGCTNWPASLDFAEEERVMIFTTDSQTLPKLTVGNLLGAAIEPTPELEFTTKPHGHLLVIDGAISPIKNGDVTLTARVQGRDLTDSIRLRIVIVDRLELTEPSDAQADGYGVTDEFSFAAKAFSEGQEIEVDNIRFRSSNDHIVATSTPGRFRAMSPGSAKVSAILGRLETSIDVAVLSQIDRIELQCPQGSVHKSGPGNPLTCLVAKDRTIRLTTQTSYKNVVIDPPEMAWAVDDASIASVSKLGWILGLRQGTTTLSVWSAHASAQMTITVTPWASKLGQANSEFECTKYFKTKINRKPYRRKFKQRKKTRHKKRRTPRARRSRRMPKIRGGKPQRKKWSAGPNGNKSKVNERLDAGVVDGWCESEHGLRCIDRWIANAGSYEAEELQDFAWRCCCVLDFVGDGYNIARPPPKKPKTPRNWRHRLRFNTKR